MKFSEIKDAITDLQRGRFIVIIDDENRENEADLVIAAEKATPSRVNFMIKNAGGLICVPMLKERLEELNIPLMIPDSENTEITKCKFTISVDFKPGTTTGISAGDRSATIRSLADPDTKAEEFARPGHIFPLKYTEGGVLKREGHTEAAIDMCKLAELGPVGVLCEILKEDGSTLKTEDLEEYASKHDLKIISIEELIKYRKNI